MNILSGDTVWGPHKIRLYLGVSSMHFRVFFKVNVQNGRSFWGYSNFKYFLGVLEIPYIFWGLTVYAGPELTYKEI